MEKKRPVAATITAITHGDEILLMKRIKDPYKGYWAFVGGKIELDENVEEASLREVKEETGLDCKFDGLKGIIHERLKERGETTVSFILFLSKAIASHKNFSSCDEGELKWFKMNDLKKEKIVPSDFWMLVNLLNSKSPTFHSVTMDQENGILKNFNIE